MTYQRTQLTRWKFAKPLIVSNKNLDKNKTVLTRLVLFYSFPFVLILLLAFMAGCGGNEQSKYSKSELNHVGVIVSTTPRYTKWRIPLAKTHETDKKVAFEMMIEEYQKEIENVSKELEGVGFGLDKSIAFANKNFETHLRKKIKQILELSSESESEMIHTLGNRYPDFKEMPNWKTYVIPQAFILFIGASFGAGLGPKGGISPTFFFVVQPWLEVTVDNRTGKQVASEWVMATEIFGIPNLSFGTGVGAEAGPMFGVGATFGPMHHPSEMGGVAVGVNGGLPIGAFGQVSFIMQNPVIYYVTLGMKFNKVSTGGVEAELPVLMDLSKFKAVLQMAIGVDSPVEEEERAASDAEMELNIE